MSVVDYKKKYQEIRLRFVEAIDASYKQGYSQGALDTRQEMMSQQLQQQAQMQNQAIGQPQQLLTSQTNMSAPKVQQDDSLNGDLDQHIAALEELVNKNEISPDDLKKSIQGLRLFTKEIQQKPKGKSYTYNMSEESKRDLSMQEKIVSDILNKWEQEAQTTDSDIMRALGVEGVLSKKE